MSFANPQMLLEGSLQAGSIMAYPVAFAGGLLASLSPCVYPLLPVTIAIIGSRNMTSRVQGFTQSFTYVIGIAFTYSVLGALAALSGNLFGMVAAHPVTQSGVGLFLIVMALGQLDIITLSMPHVIARYKQQKPVGVIAILATGMVTGLVVSPCTIPVFGALLVFVASRKNVLFGTTLMLTFAMGMGTLLIAAGTFTSVLSKIPRSGPWLITIKRAMGILLLACGIYFLVQAVKLY